MNFIYKLKSTDEERIRELIKLRFDYLVTYKIIEGNTRLFVSMPGKINKFGKEENIVFPTNKETREKIESVILDEYKKVNES